MQTAKTAKTITTISCASPIAKKHRKLLDDEEDNDYAAAITKIHDYYTNPKKRSAFGGRLNLIKESKFRAKDVERYLDSSETYTKFKLTRKRFPRLKVICYRQNEIWSVDLADLQSWQTIIPASDIYLWL